MNKDNNGKHQVRGWRIRRQSSGEGMDKRKEVKSMIYEEKKMKKELNIIDYCLNFE